MSDFHHGLISPSCFWASEVLATDHLCLQGLTWQELSWPALLLLFFFDQNIQVLSLKLLVSLLIFFDVYVCFCCSWDTAPLLIQRGITYKSSHPCTLHFFFFWTTSCVIFYFVASAIFFCQWEVLDFSPTPWFDRNTGSRFLFGNRIFLLIPFWSEQEVSLGSSDGCFA